MDRPTVFLADLHLKESPDPIRDRWQTGFFVSFLKEMKKLRDFFSISEPIPVVILGDLTDSKNRHPAHLVNYIVNGFRFWKDSGVIDPYILWGNHDMDMSLWVDYLNNREDIKRCPFFSFLFQAGLASPIYDLNNRDLPYEFAVYRNGHLSTSSSLTDIVFFHGPIKNAKIASGFLLSGEGTISPNDLFSYASLAIGGDIHRPQVITYSTHEKAIYVGSYGHTDTINIREFLETADSKEATVALGRGYSILSGQDGRGPQFSRYINPDLSLQVKMSLQLGKGATLSVKDIGKTETEFFEWLDRALIAQKYAQLEYNPLCFCIDATINAADSLAIASVKQTAGRPRTKPYFDKVYSALETRVREFSELLKRKIEESGRSKEVIFRYRNMMVESDKLQDRSSPTARMFSMTTQERVDLLKTELATVEKGELDEGILNEAIPVFHEVYAQYENNLNEDKEDTADEAD